MKWINPFYQHEQQEQYIDKSFLNQQRNLLLHQYQAQPEIVLVVITLFICILILVFISICQQVRGFFSIWRRVNGNRVYQKTEAKVQKNKRQSDRPYEREPWKTYKQLVRKRNRWSNTDSSDAERLNEHFDEHPNMTKHRFEGQMQNDYNHSDYGDERLSTSSLNRKSNQSIDGRTRRNEYLQEKKSKNRLKMNAKSRLCICKCGCLCCPRRKSRHQTFHNSLDDGREMNTNESLTESDEEQKRADKYRRRSLRTNVENSRQSSVERKTEHLLMPKLESFYHRTQDDGHLERLRNKRTNSWSSHLHVTAPRLLRN